MTNKTSDERLELNLRPLSAERLKRSLERAKRQIEALKRADKISPEILRKRLRGA